MARRVLVTGLSSFWGGRLAQTLEKDPAIEAIIGVSPDDPTCELERTEFVRVGTQHALLRRIVQAAEIDTVVDSRLIVDSTTVVRARRPRGERDRDDEHPRRLLGPRLARAQVRLQVLRPLLRLRAGRPRLLHRADAAPAPAAHPHRARHRRGREGRALLRRAQPRRDRDDAALRQRPRARTSGPATPGCSRCPSSRASSASTRATSSSTRTTSSACSSTPCARTCRASTTRPPTACSCCRRSPGCWASRSRRCCRRGGRASPRRRWGGSASSCRPRCSASCASAAASTTASSRPRECRCATPRARPCRRSPSICGSPRSGAERPSRTATSGKSRSSCATARASGEAVEPAAESPR